MVKRLYRRIEKIEKKLEPNKGACFRFPLAEGGFIEAPGCRTLMDVLAVAGTGRDEGIQEKMDEIERK